MENITKEKFKKDFKRIFREYHDTKIEESDLTTKYEALVKLMEEYASDYWINTKKIEGKVETKKVYYFSIEFLIGRLLDNALINLGIRDVVKSGLKDYGVDLTELESIEEDQALGNGGLGRLAACFLDSMASLKIPGHGCGIRYKYGFFKQKIVDDNQVEIANDWLDKGALWETKREDRLEKVKFYGNIEVKNDENGNLVFTHKDYEEVLAIPYDTPIVGYKNRVINTLRLWSAEPVNSGFDFQSFNHGDYVKAMEYKDNVEAISSILYPDDSDYKGKLLRLKQEYFLVSAGLQSIIRSFKKSSGKIVNFHKDIAIQLNDTHPVLAIPEFMRILLDEEKLSWDEAFHIVTNTFAYTNHTIMKEALETWNVDLVKKLLPRIYMIINEINERYCKDLWAVYEGEWDKIANMAIIQDGKIKMANLAIVGSHSVNGVAKLHTEILKKDVMNNLYNFFPNKFNNKTNGVTHRRWLVGCNKDLTKLLEETIGDEFIKDSEKLEEFESFTKDKKVLEELYNIKQKNKKKLAKYIKEHNNIDVDINSIFDVQVKRIHAYKRQTLNIFRIMDLYNKLLKNPDLDIEKRTFIFAGKAAPSYHLAKKIIELINVVADRINGDERVKDKIKVVFLENYRVSLAEIIIPAADLSEQISTATKEASGTSNMKLMLNGAVTIATLDGANIEIKDRVKEDNIVIFGLKNEEVLKYYENRCYSVIDEINENKDFKVVLNQLIDGTYVGPNGNFKEIYDEIVKANDEFFVVKDFKSYLEAQEKVDKLFRDRIKWQKMCAVNIAKAGYFSSDRTIKEYVKEIWNLK